LPFLAEAADAFPETPIVAAGGVADSRTLAAVLAAGAEGAWIGTGFRAMRECAEIGPEERVAILQSDGRDTVRNSVYDTITREACGGSRWPEGIAMRMQTNQIIERWQGHEDELAARIAETPKEYEHVWDNPASEDYGHIFGPAAQFVSKVETAAGFMHRIVGGAEHLLSHWSVEKSLPTT